MNPLEDYAERSPEAARWLAHAQGCRAMFNAAGLKVLAADPTLAAVEVISAAATALEHKHPMQDEGLARNLRWAVNLILDQAHVFQEMVARE